MFRSKIVRYREIYKFVFNYFFIEFTYLVLLNKNVFLKIKDPIYRRNIRDMEKMLRNKIFNFKQIYNFGVDYFFMEITFFYHRKILFF